MQPLDDRPLLADIVSQTSEIHDDDEDDDDDDDLLLMLLLLLYDMIVGTGFVIEFSHALAITSCRCSCASIGAETFWIKPENLILVVGCLFGIGTYFRAKGDDNDDDVDDDDWLAIISAGSIAPISHLSFVCLDHVSMACNSYGFCDLWAELEVNFHYH